MKRHKVKEYKLEGKTKFEIDLHVPKVYPSRDMLFLKKLRFALTNYHSIGDWWAKHIYKIVKLAVDDDFDKTYVSDTLEDLLTDDVMEILKEKKIGHLEDYSEEEQKEIIKKLSHVYNSYFEQTGRDIKEIDIASRR